jgi:hypothetical protein
MTTTNWQIDDRNIRLTIADTYIEYLQHVADCNDRFCCDVNLRMAIQLACQEPADEKQMTRLRRILQNRLLRKVERDHRPKAAAAIEYFKDFYKEWVSSGAAEAAIEQVTIDESIDSSIDEFMALAEDED